MVTVGQRSARQDSAASRSACRCKSPPKYEVLLPQIVEMTVAGSGIDLISWAFGVGAEVIRPSAPAPHREAATGPRRQPAPQRAKCGGPASRSGLRLGQRRRNRSRGPQRPQADPPTIQVEQEIPGASTQAPILKVIARRAAATSTKLRCRTHPFTTFSRRSSSRPPSAHPLRPAPLPSMRPGVSIHPKRF